MLYLVFFRELLNIVNLRIIILKLFFEPNKVSKWTNLV